METQEVPLQWGVHFRGFWSARTKCQEEEAKPRSRETACGILIFSFNQSPQYP